MEGSPAANERAALRAVNERVVEFARLNDDENGEFDFLSECGDPSCTETVRLTVAAYAEWADQGFVVAEGHSA